MTVLTLSDYLKKTFGTKVYKLSLSTGCTCPNRDGTVGTGGCTFCSAGGSGDFAESYAKQKSITQQIQDAKQRVDQKFPSKIKTKDKKYIAYFQSFSNTYQTVEYLRPIFLEAINQPEVVALSIATRPDCLKDDVVLMLSHLNKIKPVWIELGLQTIHEKTAESFNRGYKLQVFNDAYARLKSINLTVIVHVILGLPGETKEDMKDTVRYLCALKPELDGIKLQLLHILEGTKMGQEYKKNPFKLFTMEEYCSFVVECLKLLPKNIVVHRMTGDGPKKILIEPQWSADKKRVLNLLKKYIEEA